MDRRQRKIQDKRKKREQVKKRARLEAARRPSDDLLLVRAGSRAAFGPCFVSAGWDDTTAAGLVSVVVTRVLAQGELLPHCLLLDRTCLGVKNAMLCAPMTPDELDEFVESVGLPHGGVEGCDVLLAQSLIFHALDYAKALGFPPNADFHEALVGPRPTELLPTPWAVAERPIYVRGPDDDPRRIIAQLRQTVGSAFDYVDPLAELPEEEAGWALDEGERESYPG